jgi:hypothetical protein
MPAKREGLTVTFRHSSQVLGRMRPEVIRWSQRPSYRGDVARDLACQREVRRRWKTKTLCRFQHVSVQTLAGSARPLRAATALTRTPRPHRSSAVIERPLTESTADGQGSA